MSIKADRKNLTKCLSEVLPDDIEVLPYAPAVVTENIAYFELKSIDPDKVFGSIKLTWDLTITTSAKAKVKDQQRSLDLLTDTAIAAIVDAEAANLESVGEYFAIQEASNGAIYPATRLTFTSFTTIKE